MNLIDQLIERAPYIQNGEVKAIGTVEKSTVLV
jgi:hypothetical protein